MLAKQFAYRETNDVRDVYHNVVVALKRTQNLNNGQPSALASWIAALNLAEGNRVFHVGCGTGYYTAIMAEVVGPAGGVIAAEVDPDLAAQASESLRQYANVTVESGDGASIDPDLCDAILINAGRYPSGCALARLLNDGARMVLPLTVTMGSGWGKGFMVKITRRHDCFAAEVVSMVAIYSSPSVRDPTIEPLLKEALESRALDRLKSVRLDAHEQTGTCIVHSPAVCLSVESLDSTD